VGEETLERDEKKEPGDEVCSVVLAPPPQRRGERKREKEKEEIGGKDGDSGTSGLLRFPGPLTSPTEGTGASPLGRPLTRSDLHLEDSLGEGGTRVGGLGTLSVSLAPSAGPEFERVYSNFDPASRNTTGERGVVVGGPPPRKVAARDVGH